jgi:hypothetical protein
MDSRKAGHQWGWGPSVATGRDRGHVVWEAVACGDRSPNEQNEAPNTAVHCGHQGCDRRVG